jgi:dTDP-4-amino-4,6-dideoxygalactose transaminase
MTKPQQIRTIPFGKPILGPPEQKAVADVLAGPQLVHGPRAHEFEERFAKRMGVAHAVTVSSCTTGLHLGLHIHGIGPGHRVVVPAMTHVATAHVVEHCGAQPLFVDVLPESGNIDPAGIDAAFAQNKGDIIKAITVVHYLGLPCDMDRIRLIAERQDVLLMEDCALSVDATYGGIKAGGLGDLGVFSFYPVKHLTTAEGGMVTTNDASIADKLSKLKAFGYDRGVNQRSVPGLYDVVELGFNYRMSELHAALGLVQLDRLDHAQARRADNYRRLRNALADLDEVIVFAQEQGKARSSHYCLNAVLPKDGSVDRQMVIDHMRAKGVGTSIHYPGPVPLFTYYRTKYGYRPGQFPVAEWLAQQTVSLPVGPHVEPEDVDYIADCFKEGVQKGRRAGK